MKLIKLLAVVLEAAALASLLMGVASAAPVSLIVVSPLALSGQVSLLAYRGSLYIYYTYLVGDNTTNIGGYVLNEGYASPAPLPPVPFVPTPSSQSF